MGMEDKPERVAGIAGPVLLCQGEGFAREEDELAVFRSLANRYARGLFPSDSEGLTSESWAVYLHAKDWGSELGSVSRH
jgi:hypothetical protein